MKQRPRADSLHPTTTLQCVKRKSAIPDYSPIASERLLQLKAVTERRFATGGHRPKGDGASRSQRYAPAR